MEIFTDSAEATQRTGREFAASLVGGEVICFSGDLGAGKTEFIKGLAIGLGIDNRVPSPTFIIMRDYDLRDDKHFYHVDLYRLEENIERELTNLGITDLWGKEENIFAIEWAEKIKNLPENVIWVKIENLGEDKRKIIIER